MVEVPRVALRAPWVQMQGDPTQVMSGSRHEIQVTVLHVHRDPIKTESDGYLSETGALHGDPETKSILSGLQFPAQWLFNHGQAQLCSMFRIMSGEYAPAVTASIFPESLADRKPQG